MDKKSYTTPELAKLLGVSRITVYKRIKSGQIKAQKIGRNFAIPKSEIQILQKTKLDSRQRTTIKNAINKVVKDYRITLELLGKE